MRPFVFILIAIACAPVLAARAQSVTNAPATEIENFEQQPGVVIVKGFGEVGSVTTGAGAISVRCKESADAASGRKEYGVAIVLESPNPAYQPLLIVDYDELNSLARGLDFLGKITSDATTMPSFDATIATKSGFRAAAHSERRNGGIRDFLQFDDAPRIPLTSDQFAQFENLIVQAKATLDAMKSKNSAS